MISIENLHKKFGRQEVLRGIDLQFRAGGITAVLGPNGSGKTTLIKSVLGMVLPDRGKVCFDGQDTHRQYAYRDRIAYLPQIARFPENLRVGELLSMIKDLRRRPANDGPLIELFGLQPYLEQRLGALSGGTRQKVNLVQAFLYDCPVLILDEPTAGLDPVALLRLKDLLRKEREHGKTILITTHIMSLVEDMADEVVFLLDGRIHFQGSLRSLKERYREDDLERAIARILLGESYVFSANGHARKEVRLEFGA